MKVYVLFGGVILRGERQPGSVINVFATSELAEQAKAKFEGGAWENGWAKIRVRDLITDDGDASIG